MSNEYAEMQPKFLEAFYNELKTQLISEVKGTFLTEVKALIKQEMLEGIGKIKEGIIVDEYMPVKYFLQKYEFSRETFRRILNSGRVHSYYKISRKIYHVEQFKKALDAYKPLKPVFVGYLKKVA